jgi:hypothetical protein
MSKKAATVIDDWKLPIFKRHLDAAGYKYDEPVPFTDGTLVLKVHYEWVHEEETGRFAPVGTVAQQRIYGK